MASEIDICNLALSHLGDTANISDFNEGSANADHCRMFYPIARDLMLERPWSFNTRRSQLAALGTVPPSNWKFGYGLPNNMFHALTVLAPGANDDQAQDFAIESMDDDTRVLLTNVENAILRYCVQVTDTTKFTPLFIDSLGWLLASYLAGPLIKGQEGIAAGRAAYQTYTAQMATATSSDANQRQGTLQVIPSAISARSGISQDTASSGFYTTIGG